MRSCSVQVSWQGGLPPRSPGLQPPPRGLDCLLHAENERERGGGSAYLDNVYNVTTRSLHAVSLES